MKILADFDKLISEQTGNTGLRCLIIINVAYLQRIYHNMKLNYILHHSLFLMPQHIVFLGLSAKHGEIYNIII